MNNIPIKNYFEYEQIEKITSTDGTRVYKTPSGSLPSVTTILSLTSDKSGIEEWKERIGQEEANKQIKQATDLGGLMHENIENKLKSLNPPRGNNIIHQMASKMCDIIFQKGLINVEEIWGIEEPLYFPGLYAGTADLIGIYKGVPSIIDFKTSKKIKPEEYIQDYYLQGCAYSHAHNELFETEIYKSVVLMVDREFNFQEYVLEKEYFNQYSKEWFNRLKNYYNLDV